MSEKKIDVIKYSLLEMISILFWVPFGMFIFNFILLPIVGVFFVVVSSLVEALFLKIFPFSFGMFVMSNRLDIIVRDYFSLTVVVYNILILIITIELIAKFKAKYSGKKDHGEKLKDAKNQILFKKPYRDI